MTGNRKLEVELEEVLSIYRTSFSAKLFTGYDETSDALMDLFGITPTLKAENRQYWGRELGMCWERLLIAVFRHCCGPRYSPGLRYGADAPCDLIVDDFAIDTKYRIGSGDSGTLKKFRANGVLLAERGFRPLMIILREDNLPAAIQACLSGGWEVKSGAGAFDTIATLTDFDLQSWMEYRRGDYLITIE